MRPDIRVLLRPLVRTVALLLALALGAVACRLVLLSMVRGSYAEAFLPFAGAATIPSTCRPSRAAQRRPLTERFHQ